MTDVKEIKSTYSKEFIQDKLSTSNTWVRKALIILHNRQTTEEQATKSTHVMNGRGFNGTDSSYLSWAAEWVKKNPNVPMNEKHFIKAGSKLKKYWGQIQEEIINKQQQEQGS